MKKCEYWWRFGTSVRKCGKDAAFMVGNIPCCLKHSYKYESEFAKEKEPIKGEQPGK